MIDVEYPRFMQIHRFMNMSKRKERYRIRSSREKLYRKINTEYDAFPEISKVDRRDGGVGDALQ
jgi:hypothetical protein